MPPTDQSPDRSVSRRVVLIAALGRNRVIGADGDLPWHLPRDLKHFKQTTLGKPVIMGRKTWETLAGPLPGRQNIVVTRNPDYHAPGCETANSLEQALELARGDDVMVVGGGDIYRLALPHATHLVLTRVDAAPPGDARFPAWDLSQWDCVARERHSADDRHAHDFDIETWVRR